MVEQAAKDRWDPGVQSYAAMGYYEPRLRTQGHRRPRRLPGHAAGRRRPDRGRGRRGGRVLDRDLDGGLDRPADREHALPGEVLPGGRGARPAGRVLRLRRLRHRPVRGGVDRQPDLLDHRQRVRLQAAEGAAAGGHADPGRVREDVPGPGARHRDGTRDAQQVRPSAARRDHQAEARTVRPQLRPGRLRGLPRRPRLHQGRREHQLAAVHALAGPLPVRDGGRQQGDGRDRRDQGPLPQRHRRRRWRRCTTAPSSPRNSAASS